jgi:hypothetical protein
MAKAVLVMDMPESCPDCRFFESDWKECYAISKRYNRDVMTEEAKPNWCPLRELPEKEHNDNGYDEYSDGYDAGWNACLDEILK